MRLSRGILIAAFAAVVAISWLAPGRPALAAVAPCSMPTNVPMNITVTQLPGASDASPANAAMAKSNQASLNTLDGAIYYVTSSSNKFLEQRNPADAQCAMSRMTALASGRAMLGAMSSPQANVERLWRATGMAVIYYTERKYASTYQRSQIEPWLTSLAQRANTDLIGQSNNIHCWVGLLNYATGQAEGNGYLISLGAADYSECVSQIDGSGYLPQELKRGAKALHYHNYALMPLVVTAEIGEQNGADLYAVAGGAIHRLASRVQTGIAAPNQFDAGMLGKQDVPSSGELEWAAFYRRRFAGRVPTSFAATPLNYAALGGDMSALAAYWAGEAPPK